MSSLPQLDHTVINVRYQMDQAAAWFQELGFHLTDRGYHSLGSINHLMMFTNDYLELIGLPEKPQDNNSGRPDIANAPLGINGLVFKTSNVDETFAHLQQIGMAGDPPKSFSRPVELPDGTFDARFRTVHVRGDVFPGGRVYFCEHGTPELVWRPEWQNHNNNTISMPEFVVASDNHDAEAEKMAKLLQSEAGGSADQLNVKLDGTVLTFQSHEAYKNRYGDLASDCKDRGSIFGAMVMRVKSLDDIRQISSKMNTPVLDEPERVVVRQKDFDSVLEFVS